MAGALAECAKLPHNRENISKSGGIKALVGLLTLTNKELLENVTKVLGECANEMECMTKIEELDGVRLIWSLLKNKSTRVQASAAWALVPCIQNSRVRPHVDLGMVFRFYLAPFLFLLSRTKKIHLQQIRSTLSQAVVARTAIQCKTNRPLLGTSLLLSF